MPFSLLFMHLEFNAEPAYSPLNQYAFVIYLTETGRKNETQMSKQYCSFIVIIVLTVFMQEEFL